jgi:hypothetical protein
MRQGIIVSKPRWWPRGPLVLAVCGILMVAFVASTSAGVVSSTPTLPVLDVPYASATGVGCFPAASVCVTPGTLTFDSVVSSTFNGSGQDIVADISYAGTLTTLSNTPIGPVTLSGTIEEEVLGRTTSTELGSWAVDIVALSLSGPVLGHTLTLTLDPGQSSTGGASITTFGETAFRIDSFFDVFVELNLDTPTPLTAHRGPLHLTTVPEPSSLVLVVGGLIAIVLFVRRRKVAAI